MEHLMNGCEMGQNTTRCRTLHMLRRYLVQASLDFVVHQRHSRRVSAVIQWSALPANRSSSPELWGHPSCPIFVEGYHTRPELQPDAMGSSGSKGRLLGRNSYWTKAFTVATTYPSQCLQHHPHRDVAVTTWPSSVSLCSACADFLYTSLEEEDKMAY